ncbi:hypothetical protein ACE7GA_12355 [Roseomonas sp. CCTCC AB2023176]|uniref:hypothetical protein n=1 Tax=Roseomonas sp. CCTCC AB2023176 TaxID=3342640 RepID=UPI0035DCA493
MSLAIVTPQTVLWHPRAIVQVQSVLYNSDPAAVARAATSVARAADLAIGGGGCAKVVLRYGDCSPLPCLGEDQLAAMRDATADTITIEYTHFGANLGSARGHNELAGLFEGDFIQVQNPDVVISPRTIVTLLKSFERPGVGMVEAKQLPIEHPKDYDRATGETSWASTACVLIPMPVFRHVGGFDADNFFLYCDDVDFSWMVRLAGFRVLHQPAAVVLHDKRLSASGAWQTSAAERYYSAEAALIIAHKWSRPDLVEQYVNFFCNAGTEEMKKAARAFETRQAEGRLPMPLDPEHKVAQFVQTFYAPHRFQL